MIELLCDPDHINQTLYNWLDYRERLVWEHKSTYTYAATYESFMEMIEKCTELEHLKQMRYNIISEIIQATAIQHFKRLKGEDTGLLTMHIYKQILLNFIQIYKIG